jgi:hypothetical protein
LGELEEWREIGKLGFRQYIYVRWEIYIGPPIGPLKIGPCLGLALWAEVAAQALSTYRVVPALSTINRASGRAKAVLFRAVPRASNRAWPIWNTIHGSRASSRTYGNAPPRELLDSACTAVSCSDARLTPPPRPTTDDLVRIMAADTYVLRTGAGGGCAVVVVVVVGFIRLGNQQRAYATASRSSCVQCMEPNETRR